MGGLTLWLLTAERRILLLPGKQPKAHFPSWRKETGGRRPGGDGRGGGGRGGLCSLRRGRSEDYISQAALGRPAS